MNTGIFSNPWMSVSSSRYAVKGLIKVEIFTIQDKICKFACSYDYEKKQAVC